MVGDVSLVEGLQAATKATLDLVEISPNTKPPVCKVLDYGKFRYEAQKKAKEAKKHQKTIQIKEIKLRPNIDVADYNVKLKNARKFLEAGDKVKCTLRFRGREIAHNELGLKLFHRLAGDVADIGKVEQDAKLEGRQMHMLIGPGVTK